MEVKRSLKLRVNLGPLNLYSYVHFITLTPVAYQERSQILFVWKKFFCCKSYFEFASLLSRFFYTESMANSRSDSYRRRFDKKNHCAACFSLEVAEQSLQQFNLPLDRYSRTVRKLVDHIPLPVIHFCMTEEVVVEKFTLGAIIFAISTKFVPNDIS